VALQAPGILCFGLFSRSRIIRFDRQYLILGYPDRRLGHYI